MLLKLFYELKLFNANIISHPFIRILGHVKYSYNLHYIMIAAQSYGTIDKILKIFLI